jgi:hypothetical protein
MNEGRLILVGFAILLGLIVGIATGVLTSTNGGSFATAILAGGAALAGTVLLTLAIATFITS